MPDIDIKDPHPDKKPEKKKGPVGKLQESMDSQSEQLAVLSTFVRLGVVVWSGFILTLNYVEIPGLGKQERIDPTFIASVFTGALASFGLETAKKRGDGTYEGDADNKPMNKKEMQEMLAAQPTNVQTIRVETLPVRIIGPNDKA